MESAQYPSPVVKNRSSGLVHCCRASLAFNRIQELIRRMLPASWCRKNLETSRDTIPLFSGQTLHEALLTLPETGRIGAKVWAPFFTSVVWNSDFWTVLLEFFMHDGYAEIPASKLELAGICSACPPSLTMDSATLRATYFTEMYQWTMRQKLNSSLRVSGAGRMSRNFTEHVWLERRIHLA